MDPEEVIKTEAENTQYIHLYFHQNRIWGCCGRSAYLLHMIYPNIPCYERDVLGSGVLLTVMVIDHMTLAHLIENFVMIERSDNKIVIEISEELSSLCNEKYNSKNNE